MKKIGLYIHIPFCIKKCNYCDFYSVKSNDLKMDEYVINLKKSFQYWSAKATDAIIDTVYFGGGTPSILGTERILRILFDITESFNVSNDAEITIEVNPNSIDKLDFLSLKKSGLNRVSIGLQSSSDEELSLLGRQHTHKDAQCTIENIIKANISNFSLDVMLGIPLQTYDSLSDTLSFCLSSGAKHISTYMLKIEENTPFFLNKDGLIFADDDLQADLYNFTCKYLQNAGMRHYEISNFCSDNLISRHNMKYWKLDDYIGIGPSAHSLFDGVRYFYPRSFSSFYNNELIFESEGHTPEEYIMLSLRTDEGFIFDKYKKLFNLSPSVDFINEGKQLEKLGFVIVDEVSVRLTEKGYLVSNAIISRFLNIEI